jgi:hypothetical protein
LSEVTSAMTLEIDASTPSLDEAVAMVVMEVDDLASVVTPMLSTFETPSLDLVGPAERSVTSTTMRPPILPYRTQTSSH